jgi:hypothetical protein
MILFNSSRTPKRDLLVSLIHALTGLLLYTVQLRNLHEIAIDTAYEM